MRIPRIFYPFKEEENNSIILNITASHHLKVINIKEGQNIELFNGNGYFFNAKVAEQNKKNITLKRISDINFQKKQIPSINIAVADIRSFDKVIREVCQSGIDSITSVKTKKTKFSKLSSEKKIYSLNENYSDKTWRSCFVLGKICGSRVKRFRKSAS